MRAEPILSVIHAYDDWIVRGYCWGRFGILRQRFLDDLRHVVRGSGHPRERAFFVALGSDPSDLTVEV